MKKQPIICGLIAFIMVAMAINPYAKAKTGGETWEYPLTRQSDEWNEIYDYNDRVLYNQVPEDVLNQLSTQELLDLVSDYPLLYTLRQYDNSAEGYEVLKKSFNGLRELLNRSDCIECVKTEYDKLVIPETGSVDYASLVSEDNYVADFNSIMQNRNIMAKVQEDAQFMYKVSLLELIMAEYTYSDIREEIAKYMIVDDVMNSVEEKAEQKANSELYMYEYESDFYDYLNEKSQNEQIVEMTAQPRTTNLQLKTPGGNTFSVIKSDKLKVVAPSATMIDAIEGSRGTVVSSASITFNCNSYAWLSTLYPDRYQYYWLNYSSSFISDKTYKKETTPSQKGEVACWTSSNHSAIIVGINVGQYKGKPMHKMLAKWKDGPMVLHDNFAFDDAPLYYLKK